MAARAQFADHEVLAMVRLRAQGLSMARVAATLSAIYGREIEVMHVNVCTNKVRRADLAQSGEPEDVVRRAYW